MLQYRYDTQLLIDGCKKSMTTIQLELPRKIPGDCLLVVGDAETMKLHYHTNFPWKVLEYAASLGEIYDIIVEDMQRQTNGLHG